jgi:hypothetical protein
LGTTRGNSTDESPAGANSGSLVLNDHARLLEAHWQADDLGSFTCPIPGHVGRARLIAQDGILRLGCCTGRWRSLGETRLCQASGHDMYHRTNIEIATWTRRFA